MCKCRCMWIWVWIFKGASKTPTQQKKSPNCADDAPVHAARARARAMYGSIINTIGFTFSLVAVFYQQKTVKSNAKCIFYIV